VARTPLRPVRVARTPLRPRPCGAFLLGAIGRSGSGQLVAVIDEPVMVVPFRLVLAVRPSRAGFRGARFRGAAIGAERGQRDDRDYAGGDADDEESPEKMIATTAPGLIGAGQRVGIPAGGTRQYPRNREPPIRRAAGEGQPPVLPLDGAGHPRPPRLLPLPPRKIARIAISFRNSATGHQKPSGLPV